jgi:predicted metal-dependent hydrolase
VTPLETLGKFQTPDTKHHWTSGAFETTRIMNAHSGRVP